MTSLDAGTGSGRVYVDMVGDLFYAGHVSFLQAARSHGDRLVVGVLADEAAASYKRRPIISLAERVGVMGSCRHVDELIENARYPVTDEFLAENNIATVVHGDDMSPDVAEPVYGPAAAAGMLKFVQYIAGIPTTELIRRVQASNLFGLRSVSALMERRHAMP